MTTTEKLLNNIPIMSGPVSVAQKNTPKQYGDRQHRYMRERNAKFVEQRAYLADDYFIASVQGLSEDFYDWQNVYIRLADVTSRVDSQAMKTDDFKQVLFQDTSIDYIPIGAKITVAGSTWLVTNPANISAANAKTVVTRCNSSYNSFDGYGNVITEPIFVENVKMLDNDNVSPNNVELLSGHVKITCQLNENTANLRVNRRLILGTQAFYVTGVQDFIQEFTGDRDSVHLITFTARLEEPTELDDVSENFIAGGKAHTFSAYLYAPDRLNVGDINQLNAYFLVDDVEIPNSSSYPVNWIWSSSDTNILSVSESGFATANSSGSVTVTAVLRQNPNVYASAEVTVGEEEITRTVSFKGIVSDTLKQYSSMTVSAAYYEDLAETDNELYWSFSGADESDYEAIVAEDGKSVKLTCLSASSAPLSIRASYEDYSVEMSVLLEGY